MSYHEAIDDIVRYSALIETRYKVFLRKYAKCLRRRTKSASSIKLSIPMGTCFNLLDIIELTADSDICINIDMPFLENIKPDSLAQQFVSEALKLFKQ